MVKQRFTALDVRASVEELQHSLVGLRLLNLYDINSHMFIFKFGHGENKKSVLLENGVRIHLSDFAREKPKIPSQFTLKVRKHVRAWRLDSISQLQHDRTIDMCFGVKNNNHAEGGDDGGSHCFHIIIELFSKGNVILTDQHYNIMMLLRSHKENGIPICVKAVYPITTSFEEAKQQTIEQNNGNENNNENEKNVKLWEDFLLTFQRNNENETLKATLSGVSHFGPALADHIVEVMKNNNNNNNENHKNKLAEFIHNKRKKKDLLLEYGKRHAIPEEEIINNTKVEEAAAKELFELLLPGMLEALDLTTVDLAPGGYLIQDLQQQKSNNNNNQNNNDNNVDATEVPAAVRYEDFTPFLFAQYQNKNDRFSIVFRESFGKVCDEYFLYSETEKIDTHNDKKKSKVLSKREKFERDFQRRISALEAEQEKNKQIGEMILLNADKIDEAMQLINGALAAGIQWEALKSLVKRRHQEGHPVAYMIHELLLEKNTISVLLEQPELYDDEDENEIPPMVVEVLLSKTAHANASDYFNKKKQHQVKLEKTIAATEKAAAGVERKTRQTEAKQVTKKNIKKERTRNWWEKFSWFRTSSGDLVLAGKDIQTTELLFRRIVQKGDLMIHCDVEGALPCLLRPLAYLYSNSDHNDNETAKVTQESLEEAGGWCVSRSSAWESKQSYGSWWIYASQLTGGTASGTYLYRGEKQHIHPQPLSLGVGLLFYVEGEEHLSPAREEVAPCGEQWVVPDPCQEFHYLPALETTRQAPSTRPQQQNNNNNHQNSNNNNAGKPKNRNARANRPEKQTEKENRRREFNNTDVVNDDDDAATVDSANAHLLNRPITKREKRKLKKIQQKYADQDEDDRQRGALLNGNKLSQVQIDLIESEKERKRLAQLQLEAEERALEDQEEEEKEKKRRKAHPQEDVEEVSDFSDEEEQEEEEATKPPEEKEEQEQKPEDEHHHDNKQNHQKQGKKEHNTANKMPPAEYASQQHAEIKMKFAHYTKHPKENDVLLHVVPVCAPYRTLMHDTARSDETDFIHNYLCKMELLYGTSKKGQTAQTCLTYFQQVIQEAKQKTKKADSEKDKSKQEASDAFYDRLTRAVEDLPVEEVVEQLRANVKTQNVKLKKK